MSSNLTDGFNKHLFKVFIFSGYQFNSWWVLLENNSVLPHYLDNTVINSSITALLILKTSVDKLLLLGI